jgi:hypothetical protein
VPHLYAGNGVSHSVDISRTAGHRTVAAGMAATLVAAVDCGTTMIKAGVFEKTARKE